MKISDGKLIDVRDEDVPEDGTLVLPDDVTEISNSALCSKVRVLVGNNVKKVTDSACIYDNLQEIYLPQAVIVSRHAFSGCRSLKKARLLKDRTLNSYIGVSAFANTALSELDISGYDIVDKYVFEGSYSLTKLCMHSTREIAGTGAIMNPFQLQEVEYVDKFPEMISIFPYSKLTVSSRGKERHFLCVEETTFEIKQSMEMNGAVIHCGKTTCKHNIDECMYASEFDHRIKLYTSLESLKKDADTGFTLKGGIL